METNKQFLGLFLFFFMLFSCKSSMEGKREAGFTLITLSIEDQQKLGIEYGSVTISTEERNQLIIGEVKSNYYEKFIVPVPIKGFLTKLYVKNGDRVNKGQLLAVLTHPDYIELQRQYLETKSDYNFLKNEYERQGELGLEAATSLKIMQKAENEFTKIEVKLMALKAKLNFIGIVADSLNIENISSNLNVYAPQSGEIIHSESLLGTFLTEDKPLMQIATISEKWINIDFTEGSDKLFCEGLNLTISSSQNKGRYITLIVHEEKLKREDGSIKLYIDSQSILFSGEEVNIEMGLQKDTIYTLPLSAIVTISGKTVLFKKASENQIMVIPIDSNYIVKIVTSLMKEHPEWKDDTFVIRGAEKLQSKYGQ